MSARHARRSRRCFAAAGLFALALVHLTSSALAQGAVAPPPPISLPACTQEAQPVSLDLSTTSVAPVDPNWTVSAVSASASPSTANLNAYHLTTAQVATIMNGSLPGWALLPNWLQPSASPLPNSAAAVGYYTYQMRFNIPCPVDSYRALAISGQYWADNTVTAFLVNGNSVPSVPLCSNPNACPTVVTAFSIPRTNLQSGVNTITIVVHNAGFNTGLAVTATLNGTCGDACVPRSGLLKICKVAGSGVAVGTPFTFTVSGVSASYPVPAGPAPGGTCVIGPTLPVGTTVTVTETPMAGYVVSNITVAPSSQLASPPPNLAAGTVNVLIGTGVTEVTYTDVKTTGFIEICKRGDVDPKGTYAFTINGTIGPLVVPLGACSSTIEVPAGPVVIQESIQNSPGISIIACNTIPASPPCTVTSPTAVTVSVSAGDVSTQTIAIITNGRRPPPPGGGG